MMRPNNSKKKEERFAKTVQTALEIQKQRAIFHVAGHACAICIINKQRRLPPVYFQIKLNNTLDIKNNTDIIYQKNYRKQFATLEDGLLINNLPQSLTSLSDNKSTLIEDIESKIEEAIFVFETDIINLLIGPLSELKYICLYHDRAFNQEFLGIVELEHYGGCEKLLLIKQYLRCISDNDQEREEKLAELFSLAIKFVQENENWVAISRLADFLSENEKSNYFYEDIASILCL